MARSGAETVPVYFHFSRWPNQLSGQNPDQNRFPFPFLIFYFSEGGGEGGVPAAARKWGPPPPTFWGTKNMSDKFFIEVFTQYGFNDFLLMNERRLYGSGIRYRILNREILSGYVGVGAMHEEEIYNLGSDFNMNLLRSTNYLSWKIRFNETSSLQNTAYYQFDTKNTSDRRILYDGDLNIALNNKLVFTLSLNFRYDSEPHGDLGKTYIQLKNGIEYIF